LVSSAGSLLFLAVFGLLSVGMSLYPEIQGVKDVKLCGLMIGHNDFSYHECIEEIDMFMR